MKAFLAGMILCIGTIEANASPKSYFEVLGDMYKAGSRPSLEKLINVAWAGRCFSPENPNRPFSGGYVFRLEKADVGPIASIKYQGFNYIGSDESPANYFDNKVYSQILDSVFWTEWAGYEVTAKEIESWFTDHKINGNAIIQKFNKSHWIFNVSLKLSGKYLVAETTAQEAVAGPLGRIDVSMRCYYFVPEYKQGEN